MSSHLRTRPLAAGLAALALAASTGAAHSTPSARAVTAGRSVDRQTAPGTAATATPPGIPVAQDAIGRHGGRCDDPGGSRVLPVPRGQGAAVVAVVRGPRAEDCPAPPPDPTPDPAPAPEPEPTPDPGPAQEPVAVSGLHFDGIDDVVIGTAVDPTAALTGTARTVEAWVRLTPSTDPRAILGVWQNGAGGFYMRVSAAGRLSATIENGSAWYDAEGATRVDDGGWHHVAMVWRPGTDLDVYVDGVRDNAAHTGTAAQVPTTHGANGARVVIGASGEDPSCGPTWWCDRFIGDMDEVRYTLGARYAGDTFAAPRTMAVDNTTIGLWDLNGGAGTVGGTITDTPDARGEPTPVDALR